MWKAELKRERSVIGSPAVARAGPCWSQELQNTQAVFGCFPRALEESWNESNQDTNWCPASEIAT